MKKNNIKVLIGSGIVCLGAAGASLFSYLTTKLWVNIALDRKLPKGIVKRNLSKNKKDDALLFERRKQSEKLERSNLETFKIISRDGETLIAHLHQSHSDKRIIIAMHGWRSSWTNDFGLISDFWHENDCSVLYVEQRGQNNSSGDYMGFGMIERHDCLEWINWVNAHNEKNLPIYLAGISMGASTVLMASGFKLPENVHGIMADCGFTSADAIWRYIAKKNKVYYKIRSRTINNLCKKKIRIGTSDYTTLDALKTNTIPVLFVHGTDDDVVPVEMTYENYNACTAPKTLFIVPGASHGASYLIDKNNYENVVKEFWNNYD